MELIASLVSQTGEPEPCRIRETCDSSPWNKAETAKNTLRAYFVAERNVFPDCRCPRCERL